MKHDRITQLSSAEYLELIEHTPFVARTTLTSLIHDTEEKFRCVRLRSHCTLFTKKCLSLISLGRTTTGTCSPMGALTKPRQSCWPDSTTTSTGRSSSSALYAYPEAPLLFSSFSFVPLFSYDQIIIVSVAPSNSKSVTMPVSQRRNSKDPPSATTSSLRIDRLWFQCLNGAQEEVHAITFTMDARVTPKFAFASKRNDQNE
jgi:hypothetical protein